MPEYRALPQYEQDSRRVFWDRVRVEVGVNLQKNMRLLFLDIGGAWCKRDSKELADVYAEKIARCSADSQPALTEFVNMTLQTLDLSYTRNLDKLDAVTGRPSNGAGYRRRK